MPSKAKAQFGMIGMAVMGRNLALNILDHDYSVAGYNLGPELMQQAVEESGSRIHPTATLAELVQSLERPRRIMMMIKAGKPVDIVLDQLAPLLEPGDVVIDGGNSWYQDTRRREAGYAEKKLQFLGVGVSGGEEGARYGPSLMPGGHRDAYQQIRPILEAIAAKTDSGACVTHVGSDGAGHFVKMVHNGIEYADMQNIAEALWGQSCVLSVVCSAGGGMMRPPVCDRREQMPVYVYRWPNGDCSVVQARTKQAAIIKLDEMDNAEGCPFINSTSARSTSVSRTRASSNYRALVRRRNPRSGTSATPCLTGFLLTKLQNSGRRPNVRPFTRP